MKRKRRKKEEKTKESLCLRLLVFVLDLSHRLEDTKREINKKGTMKEKKKGEKKWRGKGGKEEKTKQTEE